MAIFDNNISSCYNSYNLDLLLVHNDNYEFCGKDNKFIYAEKFGENKKDNFSFRTLIAFGYSLFGT